MLDIKWIERALKKPGKTLVHTGGSCLWSSI